MIFQQKSGFPKRKLALWKTNCWCLTFCFKTPRRVNFYTNNRRQVIVYKCSKAAIFQNNNDAAEKTKLASCIFVEKLAIISSFRNAKIARIEKEMPVAIRPFQRLKA